MGTSPIKSGEVENEQNPCFHYSQNFHALGKGSTGVESDDAVKSGYSVYSSLPRVQCVSRDEGGRPDLGV